MGKNTLVATAAIAEAMRRRKEEREAIKVRQQSERERQAVEQQRRLEASREVSVGLARTFEEAIDRGEHAERGDGGSVEVLSRDGLLWLIRRNRLTAEQRSAAEWYRKQWNMVHLGGVGSCIADRLGGSAQDMTAAKIGAARELNDVRRGVFMGDPGLCAVMDGVCGEGRTLRDLAREQRLSELMGAELSVALRLLAAHLIRLRRIA